jgi:hypothetical protein
MTDDHLSIKFKHDDEKHNEIATPQQPTRCQHDPLRTVMMNIIVTFLLAGSTSLTLLHTISPLNTFHNAKNMALTHHLVPCG